MADQRKLTWQAGKPASYCKTTVQCCQPATGSPVTWESPGKKLCNNLTKINVGFTTFIHFCSNRTCKRYIKKKR